MRLGTATMAAATFGAAAAAVLAFSSARADPTPGPAAATDPFTAPDDDPSRWLKELDVQAGTVDADLKLRELDLRDGVNVRMSPYYLHADRIHLSLTKWGVRVVGHGVLTFCPCDSPPISIGFSGGYAGPPDELIVEDPTLRIFGVPVLWVPYLWLRSPRKIGLTAPEISFRGSDGLFLGQGVHLPMGKDAEGRLSGLELAAGGYTRGGFAATADLATTRTHTLVRFDYRSAPEVGARDDVPSGVGLAIDSVGALGDGPSIAWDVDAIRGARGLRTTLNLEPLARPYDRALAEARLGPLRIGGDVLDRRGDAVQQIDVARAYAAIGGGFALGELGGGSASLSLGPRFVRARRVDAIADASLSADLGGALGVATLSSRTQLDARAARDGGSTLDPMGSTGGSGGRAAAAVVEQRLELSLPLARKLDLDRARAGPPVLHVIEPLLRAVGVAARAGGDREALAGSVAAPLLGGSSGAPYQSDGSITQRTIGAAILASGVRTSIGAMAGGIAPGTDPWIGKLTAEATFGALITEGRRDLAGAGELAFTSRRADGGGFLLGAQGAVAKPMRATELDAGRAVAFVGVGRVRFDTSRDGLRVELRGAARGSMPVIGGWALLGADAAPRLATATGLAIPGTTFGFGTGFPIGLGLRLGGDVDAYADSFTALTHPKDARLLDLHSTLRYRHPCGCFRLGVRAGHVVGREGVDLFATFELARTEATDTRDW